MTLSGLFTPRTGWGRQADSNSSRDPEEGASSAGCRCLPGSWAPAGAEQQPLAPPHLPLLSTLTPCAGPSGRHHSPEGSEARDGAREAKGPGSSSGHRRQPAEPWANSPRKTSLLCRDPRPFQCMSTRSRSASRISISRVAFFLGSTAECSLGHACPETNPPLAPVPDSAGAMQCQTAASSAAYATVEGHTAHTCRRGTWDLPPYPPHACPCLWGGKTIPQREERLSCGLCNSQETRQF